jgi:hypothetical protein
MEGCPTQQPLRQAGGLSRNTPAEDSIVNDLIPKLFRGSFSFHFTFPLGAAEGFASSLPRQILARYRRDKLNAMNCCCARMSLKACL